jgi:hypothetical protein
VPLAGQAYVELIPKLSPGFQADVAKQVAPSGEAAGGAFLTGFSKRLDKASTELNAIGSKLTTRLSLPLLAAAGVSVKYAAELDHSLSQASTVYGTHAKVIVDFGKKAATSIGISEQASIDYSNKLGQMFEAMHFGQADSAKMSVGLQQLAGDLGSLRNVGADTALDVITKAMAGQYRGLKQIGVVMDANLVKQRAEKLGLYDGKGAIDNNARAQAVLSLITDQTSIAHGQFAKRTKELGEASRITRAQLKDSADELGQHLLPIGKQLLTWANDLLKGFRSLGPEGEKIALAMLAIGIAAGPLLKLFGGVFKLGSLAAANPYVVLFLAVAAAIALVAMHYKEIVKWIEDHPLFAGLAAVAASILMPILIPIVAIGVAVGWLVDHWREVVTWVTNAYDAVVKWVKASGIIETVRDAISDTVAWLRQAGTDLGNWWEDHVSPVWGKFERAVSAAFNVARGIFNGFVSFASGVWDVFGGTITDVINIAGDVIIGIFEAIGSAVMDGIQPVLDFIQNVAEGVLTTVGGILDFFTGIFTLDWSTVWQGITEIFGGAWHVVTAIFNVAISEIGNLLNMLAGILVAVWHGITGAVSEAWSVVTSIVSGAVTAIVGFIIDLPGKLLSVAGTLLEAGKTLGGNILDGLKQGVVAGVDWLGDVAKNIANGVIEAFDSVVQELNDLIPNVSFLGITIIPDNPIPKIPKLHTGGVVPGTSTGPDVITQLRPGEGVFTPEQMAALAPVGAATGGGQLFGDVTIPTVATAPDVAEELGWLAITGGHR